MNKLSNKIIISGNVEFLSGMHIGGGEAENEVTDNAVMKDVFGNPFVPGSSFKGVFRSTVEKIAANFSYKICSYEEDLPCNPKNRNKNEKEFTPDHACHSCKMFGSTVQSSKVFFSDMVLEEGLPSVMSEYRDGVAIDRDSEKAVNRQKYDYEVIPGGLKFKFEVIAENLTDAEKGLLAIGLMEFKTGTVRLGGLKSRGLGKCKMNINKIEEIDYSSISKMKEYYCSKIEKEITADQINGIINEWIQFVK